MILNLSDLGSSIGLGGAGGAEGGEGGMLMSVNAWPVVTTAAVASTGFPTSFSTVLELDFEPTAFKPGFQCVGGGLSDLRAMGKLPNMRIFFSVAALRRFSLSSSESEELELDLPRLLFGEGERLRLDSLRL